MLQIAALLDRRPKAMSGGRRQRVATGIATGRAIVRRPEVFLFDEPLSNLDAAPRVEMRSHFARPHRELQATMIFVTHAQVKAMTLADRIVVLNAGRIEQVGPPREVHHHPANLFVGRFIGSPAINLLPARVTARRGERASPLLDGGVPGAMAVAPGAAPAPGDRVTPGLRPERLMLGKGAAGPALSGRVTPEGRLIR